MRRILILATIASQFAIAAAPVEAGYADEQSIIPATRAYASAPVQSLGHNIGRIEIPAIGVDETIREGVNLRVIDQGVAHWAGTAQAGGYGNMVLAGHRTTKTRPFFDLDRLRRGDEITVTGLDGQLATYRVRETLIVDPLQSWIANWTDTPLLTLFACNPKGSARERIVIRADLVDAPLLFP